MKTIKLDKETLSVEELLAIARQETVFLVSPDGTNFVVEEADDFDQEVAQLGSSEKFMKFLEKRFRERGVTSIEQIADELNSRKA